MLKMLRVIAGDLKNLYILTAWNSLHLILRGVPFGILFLVILELLKKTDEISLPRLVMLFLFMAAIMLLNIFLAIKVHVRGYLASYALTTDARLRLGDHLRLLSLGFFKKRDPGDISALLLQDMTKVEQVFGHFFMDATACLILPLMMLCFFVMADARMTALLIASATVAFPALYLAQRLMYLLGKRHLETRNRTASRLLEYLRGMQTLKAFRMTGKGFTRLDEIMRRLRDDSIRLEGGGGLPVMLYGLLLDGGFAALLAYGGYLMAGGDIDAAVFVLFLVIGHKFFEPLFNYGVLFAELRYMNIAGARIAAVLEMPPLPENPSTTIPVRHDIVFDKVEFSYNADESAARVLRGVSFTIPGKSMTALVGPSGSGKSTVTSLMARFWDVGAGSIRIGGVDVRAIPNRDLNALFSVVFQDVYLFQDSVFNNIRVGRKDATRDEVLAAARMAQCHEFVEKMKNGYETRVGEGGVTLSGGEKQRISIARAFLKNAPIVILDEATASLDPENELQIQRALNTMVRDKTLVVIAHRLKTVVAANQILVLEKGVISQRGQHEELLAAEGLYARLWREQQRSGGWKFSKTTALPSGASPQGAFA